MTGHDRPERTGSTSTEGIVAALPHPTSLKPTATIPLPMPAIPPDHWRTSSAVYALARIDASGRITDNTTPTALAWWPGQALRATVLDDTSITLRPDHDGTAKICTRGHVVLPALVRRRCGITAGDLLLLIALPDRQLLRVHTLAYLDSILASQSESP